MMVHHITKSIILFVILTVSFDLFAQEQTSQPPSPKERPVYIKDGMSADTIREYHENGVLKCLYCPYQKKYRYQGNKYRYCLYEVYNEQGDLTRFTDDLMGIDRKYGTDSVLISETIYNRRKNKVIGKTEYFRDRLKESVIVNGNRYDYDENGRLRRYWTRKNVRYDKQDGSMMATLYFEEYDVSGEISRHGRIYSQINESDGWLQLTPEFPARMDSVPLQDFKEVVYPQLNMKETYRWDYTNNKTIVTQYEQQGAQWNESKRRFFSNKPKKIDTSQNGVKN